MSQLSKAIFGAIAVTLTLGAVQLASGHDLTAGQQAAMDTPANIINRTAKSDRATGAAASAEATRTILLRLDSISDTSVLVRVPVVKKPETEARNGPAPSMFLSGGRKAAVACEPMVSVLTEVAKRLQPGRCVT
jgi:hypothetical protein